VVSLLPARACACACVSNALSATSQLRGAAPSCSCDTWCKTGPDSKLSIFARRFLRLSASISSSLFARKSSYDSSCDVAFPCVACARVGVGGVVVGEEAGEVVDDVLADCGFEPPGEEEER